MTPVDPNDRSISRRQFIAQTGLAAAGIAAAATAGADEKKLPPARIGSGYFTYELVRGWGELPPNMTYGMGCGVVVDSKDRVYVHSRMAQSVAVFDRGGKLLTDWGAEFAATGHGLYHTKQGHDEFLYFSDYPRNLIVKTDLSGKVLARLGAVAAQSADNIPFTFDAPTDVAIAPNGDLYVCEGYGGNRIHRFTADFQWRQTIGSRGTGPDQFNIPHGMWIDLRKPEQEVYIADRANGRLQVFTPELTFKRSLASDVRQPCCFYTFHDKMYVPDLDHRVTILDKNDKAVAQLGDGRLKVEDTTFEFPHALTVDSHGDMYVIEWRPDSRLRKFKHTPQAAA